MNDPCRLCGQEGGRHASMHEHCRRCEKACLEALRRMAALGSQFLTAKPILHVSH